MGVPVTPVDPQLPTVTAPPSPRPPRSTPTSTRGPSWTARSRAYVELGVAALLGEARRLSARLEPLAEVAATPTAARVEGDDVPFVLVLPGLDLNDVAPAMRRGSRLGVSVIDRVEAPTYRPIAASWSRRSRTCCGASTPARSSATSGRRTRWPRSPDAGAPR